MSNAFGRGFVLSVSLLLASAALAQDAGNNAAPAAAPGTKCDPGSCISKVLSVPKFSSAVALRMLVTSLGALADIPNIQSSPSDHTISFEGTAEQVAIAEKLVNVLESLRSSGGQRPASVLVYEVKPSPVPVADTDKLSPVRRACQLNTCYIKVLYLPEFATPRELQDVVNMLRTVVDIMYIVPNAEDHTIALKATAEQLAISEKLVSVLDNLRASGGENRSSVLVYEVKGSVAATPRVSAMPPLRVPCEVTTCYIKALYLPDTSEDQLYGALNAMRSGAQITRIAPSPSSHVIVFRASAEQAAMAEKLMNQ